MSSLLSLIGLVIEGEGVPNTIGRIPKNEAAKGAFPGLDQQPLALQLLMQTGLTIRTSFPVCTEPCLHHLESEFYSCHANSQRTTRTRSLHGVRLLIRQGLLLEEEIADRLCMSLHKICFLPAACLYQ